MVRMSAVRVAGGEPYSQNRGAAARCFPYSAFQQLRPYVGDVFNRRVAVRQPPARPRDAAPKGGVLGQIARSRPANRFRPRASSPVSPGPNERGVGADRRGDHRQPGRHVLHDLEPALAERPAVGRAWGRCRCRPRREGRRLVLGATTARAPSARASGGRRLVADRQQRQPGHAAGPRAELRARHRRT